MKKLIEYSPDYKGQRGERFDPHKLMCSPGEKGGYYDAHDVDELLTTTKVIVWALTVITLALGGTLAYVVGTL